MFQLLVNLGYYRYGGVNLALNAWRIAPAPNEDCTYTDNGDPVFFFVLCLNFDLDRVLAEEKLTEAFQDTSRYEINSYSDAIMKQLISNDFYGGTLTREGERVTIALDGDFLDRFDLDF